MTHLIKFTIPVHPRKFLYLFSKHMSSQVNMQDNVMLQGMGTYTYVVIWRKTSRSCELLWIRRWFNSNLATLLLFESWRTLLGHDYSSLKFMRYEYDIYYVIAFVCKSILLCPQITKFISDAIITRRVYINTTQWLH